MSKTCIILSGVSGSGKSTFAELLNSLYHDNACVCSADDYFLAMDGSYNFDPNRLRQAHEHCWDVFVSALDDEIGLIIVDNTNTDKKEFQKYVDEARNRGYIVHRLIVDNTHGQSSIHNVPDHVLEKQKGRIISSLYQGKR